MNVLLVGGGGREHALAWRLAQSPGLTRLLAAPGNPGIAAHATCVSLDVADHAAVLAFARAEDIALVVVGPEVPLVAGLADDLRAGGVAVFGPSAAAARLEGSKGFTKDLCERAGIPTARYLRTTTLDVALAALDGFGLPVVVKADGLAAGKGVTVAATRGEAVDALAALFETPGAEAVIERFLHGREASLFVLCDGVATAVFGSAEDHKRVGEGDTGPNTGGMGAFSPSTVLTPTLEAEAMARIVRPTVDALAAAGTPFVGVLYAGLMLTGEGPQLIEYNVRFGDPECQALMMRFEGDLLALLLAVAQGRLAEAAHPRFARGAALGVVIAARGYPGTPATGGTVGGIAAAEATGARVFQAGTRAGDDGAPVASGGRVLTVVAAADTLAAARALAYQAVGRINYRDGFHRSDIGLRG
ncbi:MAG: phosphoribosylamine--glycine ligase [Janthinobacterium lividum]